MTEYHSAFLGGCLIGLASVLMLLFNGRILGVSGIVGAIFQRRSNEQAWCYFYIADTIAGGVLLSFLSPSAFACGLQATSDSAAR